MDRVATSVRLAKAQEAVELDERHVARQRELVDELTRDGHDASAATLLTTFETSQALQVADRDRLRSELAER